MKNKLQARAKQALQSQKGFTLVELIVVTVIVMVLATIAVSSYLKFVEDAKLAKDVAYVKNILTQMEVLAAKSEIVMPSTNATSASHTAYGSIRISGTGVWSNSYGSSTYLSSANSTANRNVVTSNIAGQDLESTVAKASGVEIRYQTINNVPVVYVYSATSGSHWFPETKVWGGETMTITTTDTDTGGDDSSVD